MGLIQGTDSTRKLRSNIANLCLKLLPEVIGLTDSFGFTDWELDRLAVLRFFLRNDLTREFFCSATGVYDGSVYQTLWDKAQTEPLNRKEVTDGYEVSTFGVCFAVT